MPTASAPPPTELETLFGALADLDFLERALLGKIRREAPFPTVLTEDGFIRSILRVGRAMKREVRLGTKEFKDRMLVIAGIDWPNVSTVNRGRAITAMANLVRGAPTIEPRVASVPVRMPLPHAERDGSIFEIQRPRQGASFGEVAAGT